MLKTVFLIALFMLLVGCEQYQECRLVEATIVESGPDDAWGCMSGVRTFYRSDFGGGKECLLLGEPGEKVTVRHCQHRAFWQSRDGVTEEGEQHD